MKFHTIDSFGFTSGSLPSGDFIAAAIATSSEVDLCMIGQHRLAPLGLVPAQAGWTVAPVRGYRTGSTTMLGAGPPRASQTLVLMLFERGDIVFPPGPRAPIVYSGRTPAIGATPAAATLLARIPMFGRSQAGVFVSRVDADTTDATIVIRGVRYLTANERAGDATPDQGYIAETTKALWEGAAAQPTSSLTATDKTLGIVYVGGGGDYMEQYDELEVWVYGTASPGVNFQVEVFGEKNR